jgi:hypothetical protein
MYEPTTVFAGSTVSWTRSSSDYGAADGYSLEYTFFNQDATWSVSGAQVVASANLWTVTIASTAWSEVPPGTYSWIARAVLGSVKVVIAEGTLTVRPDPADGAYDGRTFARRALDSVEAVMENRATEDHLSMSIAGRSISLMSPEELLRVRNALRAEVRSDENAERLRDGRPGSDIIRVRFTRPS